ncbi:hypothetical protein HJC23_001615 [Cyclotella cryptica]|uniref:ERCC1-like central domain-containing protein n=1 Tax=Cyclotella cryptica TaxID=29204 RepID=A0ABD3QJV0_9STRA|eukprot:CCRYP_004641-RA/>CCRYP_004641-RA protein AED:0.00 eAED:0.00 QI:179/-1/1/1/-1/1/1/201/390
MSQSTKSSACNSNAVINPYAKKRNTALTSLANSTAASSVVKNDVSSTAAHRSAMIGIHHDARGQKNCPPDLDVDPASTFSQAFGDYDPDAQFGVEERFAQYQFDEALAPSSTPRSNVHNTSSARNEPSARDHHVFLQPHILHVSTRQRGNPVLNHIRNVPYQLSQMVPDYIFAPTRCALFLSIRYHNLHPYYIHRRIAELKSDFELRVLLCYVDIDDNSNVLLFLNDLCVQNNLTLILAWSEEEAARYLETFKAFDGKDASLIQKREHANFIDQISHVLGSVRAVNKTDASQLLAQFGTWRNLVGASVEELSVCPGVGVKKVRRLYEAFRRPFSKEGAKKRKEKEKVIGVENNMSFVEKFSAQQNVSSQLSSLNTDEDHDSAIKDEPEQL